MILSTGRDTDIVRIVKCEPKIFLSPPIYANFLLQRKYYHTRVSNNDSFFPKRTSFMASVRSR